MAIDRPYLTRRAALAGLGALALAPARDAQATPRLTRAIPKSGERIPVIGMGTWITFNVGPATRLREARVEVLRAFFEAGGGLVDSSPMYGSSEDVIGYCLQRIRKIDSLFSATKVWTVSRALGLRQMTRSERLWGGERFDLMQIHNLLDWRTHLETLKEWRARGRIRYIGITTSHGLRHGALAKIMETEPIDFVQLTYNMRDREAERRLLPLAAERKIAVIANRPLAGGTLIDDLKAEPLPALAAEIDCQSWAQLCLKFIISHPAVTCAIPATTRVDHMRENMAAARGRLPDAEMRADMISAVERL